jgi:trehalose 6-phosphate synthase/phosphatase
MLREKRPDLTIGFFLHTPFPSYEIFRCHPKRERLLEGLLGADLVGFHTYGYLRHFKSTVLRILGVESEFDHVPTETHDCVVNVFPIGINSGKFRDFMESTAFARRLNWLRKVYEGNKIVLSVERLDYSKGIPRRLEAIDMFLEETGRKDVRFLFISVPSRQNVPEYRELRRDVELKVSQINGKHSSPGRVPIHFLFRSVKFEELCALYSLADVAVVTPFVDGMNLVAKEYLFCQRKKSGALILSEFAGAAQELSQAYVVNPYHVRQISEAIKTALDADEWEKAKRLRPMKKRVEKFDARFWAESFLKALEGVGEKVPTVSRPPVLTLEAVSRLRVAGRKVLFLDYDGTLSELKSLPEDGAPAGEVDRILRLLSKQKKYDVYLLSERDREEMDLWFSGYDINLVAENGFCHREKDDEEWTAVSFESDLSWKERLTEFLTFYTGMTPGSMLEEKNASLVWRYQNADPDFGAWKAHQLVSELQEMLSNEPVEIHHGKKNVVIASMHANKAAAAAHVMAVKNCEAALCAGDDETDESLFRLSDERIFGVRVGESKNTDADFHCPSPRDFRFFIEKLLDR